MKTEYVKRHNKHVEIKVFSFEEIKSIFNPDDWERTFQDLSFLKNVGLTAPPNTFQVTVSGTAIPPDFGIVAGICTLRIDKQDEPIGFPVNWNHWDFCLREDGNVIMIPSEQKRKDHWFQSTKD